MNLRAVEGLPEESPAASNLPTVEELPAESPIVSNLPPTVEHLPAAAQESVEKASSDQPVN